MRLVDADAILDFINSLNFDDYNLYSEIFDCIDNAPTIDTQPVMSDWIKCSDRMPEDGERILIYVHLASHESVQPDTCIEDGGYMYLDSGYSFGKEVTHWMPLPEPPKEDDEDEQTQ